MHLAAYVSLFASIIAMVGFFFQRMWLTAGVWGFLAAYTLFDKFYPDVLPPLLVDSFSIIAFLLAISGLAKMIAARHKRQTE